MVKKNRTPLQARRKSQPNIGSYMIVLELGGDGSHHGVESGGTAAVQGDRHDNWCILARLFLVCQSQREVAASRSRRRRIGLNPRTAVSFGLQHDPFVRRIARQIHLKQAAEAKIDNVERRSGALHRDRVMNKIGDDVPDAGLPSA